MERSSSPEAVARAVLVAAGESTRMRGAGARKPLLELGGKPLLLHALDALAASPCVGSIVVVAHPADLEVVRDLTLGAARVVAVVPGGAERMDSVARGACAAAERPEPEPRVLCIHDAARPLVPSRVIDATVRAALETGSGLAALPLADTLKRSADGRHVHDTLDRDGLWCAQTPQCFARERFLECLERAEAEGLRPTDDAGLWERYVGPVTLVEGDPASLKVTTPRDLELARALLAQEGRA